MTDYKDYPVFAECGIDEAGFEVTGGRKDGILTRPVIKFPATRELAKKIYAEVDDKGENQKDGNTGLGVMVMFRSKTGERKTQWMPKRWKAPYDAGLIMGDHNPSQPFEPFLPTDGSWIQIPLHVGFLSRLRKAEALDDMFDAMFEEAKKHNSESMVYVTAIRDDMSVEKCLKTLADILTEKVLPSLQKKQDAKPSISDSAYEMPLNLWPISLTRNPYLFRIRAGTPRKSRGRTRKATKGNNRSKRRSAKKTLRRDAIKRRRNDTLNDQRKSVRRKNIRKKSAGRTVESKRGGLSHAGKTPA